MDRHDAWVVERRDRLRFALEAAAAAIGIGREHRRQNLEGDPAVQLRVVGGVDLPHSASPERLDDAVVAEGVARVHLLHPTSR
jgi:hypothetical protein